MFQTEDNAMKYETAEQWHDAAMGRACGVDESERERRRTMVQSHYLQEGTEPDAERLADYELYILGKMDIEEYQQYLLFKYRP